MLVEGAPFDARHRKPCPATTVLLPCFQFAQGEGAHTGIEVNMQFGL